jgi:hypothetical protein
VAEIVAIIIPASTYDKLLIAREIYGLKLPLEKTECLYRFTQEQFDEAIAQLSTASFIPEVSELMIELRYWKKYGK